MKRGIKIGRKVFPGKTKSMYKGPEVGGGLVCLRNSKEDIMARREWWEGKGTGRGRRWGRQKETKSMIVSY